jgi:hypothetical protein
MDTNTQTLQQAVAKLVSFFKEDMVSKIEAIVDSKLTEVLGPDFIPKTLYQQTEESEIDFSENDILFEWQVKDLLTTHNKKGFILLKEDMIEPVYDTLTKPEKYEELLLIIFNNFKSQLLKEISETSGYDVSHSLNEQLECKENEALEYNRITLNTNNWYHTTIKQVN